MKHLLTATVAAAALCLASCGGGHSNADSAFIDSLSTGMGQMGGSSILSEYLGLPAEMQQQYNKAEMLRGIKTMIMNDTTKESYVTGLMIGKQLYDQISRMEKMGIKVDRKLVYEAYAKAFNADSVGDISALRAEFNTLMGRAQRMMMQEQARRDSMHRAAELERPEVKKNIEESEAYLAKIAQEPGIEKLNNGVMLMTVKEGTGDYITMSDQATVRYKGYLPDGTVFDESPEAGVPMNMRSVVPGFQTGMRQMQKGGEYKLYIPADMAYGLEGAKEADGSYKIGPMTALTFDVDILDVIDPRANK